MTILIVHTGTGTVLDASDGVLVVDTSELTDEQVEDLEAFWSLEPDAVDVKGTDIMKIISYYMGERKGN